MASTFLHTDAIALDRAPDPDALWALAHGTARPVLGPDALARVAHNRAVFEAAVAAGEPVYGVTTGVGALFDAAPPAQVARDLLRSHAATTGPGALERPLVRAAIAARAAVLAQGHSGVRPELVEALVALLAHDVVPRVPAGPLGPVGDLAPAAHLYLVLLGEGETVDGRTGAEALAGAGLAPLALDGREALALISGTSFPTAIAALGAVRVRRALDAADVAAAMSFDALGGAHSALDSRVHELHRGAPGQNATAAHLRALLAGDHPAPRLQDALSLRTAPQVHGAARDVVERLADRAGAELAAVTDNPLIFDAAPHVVANGSFQAQAIAAAADAARSALTDLASISERRTFRLLTPGLSGLPAFLAADGGSGLMIAQYTAASLVTELRLLAHPVAADSIPVSGAQEDHATNATLAAGALWTAAERAETVLAVELLCAARALELRGGPPADGTARALAIVREHAPAGDHPPGPDIERIRALVADGAFSALLGSR